MPPPRITPYVVVAARSRAPSSLHGRPRHPAHLRSRRRNLLRINAVGSGLCGLATALVSGWLAEVMGVSTIAVRVVGIGLAVFAVGVGIASSSGTGTYVDWPG